MSIPVIYSSTDAGAPVMNTVDTSTWLTVIKQCLVYGYTGKAAAGWTLAFEDIPNQILVLQQGAGNMRYLRFSNPGYDSGAAAGAGLAARWFSVASYQTMSDINTGTGMFPPVAQQNVWSLFSSFDAAASYTRAWRIFASDKLFFIQTYPQQETGAQMAPKTTFFFGDFVSSVFGDVYNTILNGYQTSPTNYDRGIYYSIQNTSWPTNFPLIFSTAGAPGTALWLAGPFYQQEGVPVSCTLTSQNLALTGPQCGNSPQGFPDFISNELQLSGINIVEYWNGKAGVRGTLPGIFAPCFQPAFPDGTIVQGQGALAAHSYMSVTNQTLDATLPNYYIQTDIWND